MNNIVYIIQRKNRGGVIMKISEVASYFTYSMPMTHKKLQKICYYAYAWYYSLYDKQLFNNNFEAWEHGPVDPLLYQKYKKYGYSTIYNNKSVDIDDEVKSFLDMIIDKYGDLSAGDLEDLSHSELPWKKARGNKLSFEPSNDPITNEYIKEFYTKQYGDIRQKDINFKEKINEYRKKELTYV